MSRSAAVLITGCNGGIGRALCEEFAAAGYIVIGTDLHDREQTPCALYLRADLSVLCDDHTAQKTMFDAVALISNSTSSGLKAIINNAALQVTGSLGELSVFNFATSQRVNVIAPFLLAKLFEDPLRAAKGAIVNIGSIHARLTKPGFGAYSTSKAALAGLTRALALEFGEDVTVNTISPAATKTEMLLDGFRDKPNKYEELAEFHPAGRIAEPHEIAKLALFLCSSSARFMTGADIAVDGGIGGRLHDPA